MYRSNGNVEYPKNGMNKSAKRDNLSKARSSDINRKKFYGFQRFPDLKPAYKAIEVSPPKLLGQFQVDRSGRNLVLDGSGGVRVYNLPVKRQFAQQSDDSVVIPDIYNLKFDLLNGYVPLKDGGNKISLNGTTCDRTAGMRWMVKNYHKLKCDDDSRLFDVDFYAGKLTGKILVSQKQLFNQNRFIIQGNATVQYLMSCQFNQHDRASVAVILFKGTYFLFLIDLKNEQTDEVSNKLSFGGIRFEDYICRGANGEQSQPSSGLNNNYGDFVKHCNVVQFKFHNFKMLITGNVDCMIPGSSAALGKKPKAEDFIEIKTTASLEDKYDKRFMNRDFGCSKASSWFAQCILMGVKHIVVGIREQKDRFNQITVKRTRAFTLEELEKNSHGFWSKEQCFDGLKKFLCTVKEKVIVDDPEIINVFEVQDGWIRGPEKKTYADDCVQFPDMSEIVELMNKL